MDKTRRLSELVIERYPDAFSADYEKNKQALKDLTIITSKQLRNHIAGYIARTMERESEDEELVEEKKAE